MNCYFCGAPATHKCAACGKWVCWRPYCNVQAAASVAKQVTKKLYRWENNDGSKTHRRL